MQSVGATRQLGIRHDVNFCLAGCHSEARNFPRDDPAYQHEVRHLAAHTMPTPLRLSRGSCGMSIGTGMVCLLHPVQHKLAAQVPRSRSTVEYKLHHTAIFQPRTVPGAPPRMTGPPRRQGSANSPATGSLPTVAPNGCSASTLRPQRHWGLGRDNVRIRSASSGTDKRVAVSGLPRMPLSNRLARARSTLDKQKRKGVRVVTNRDMGWVSSISSGSMAGDSLK